jgi:hypothetical protein
VNPGKPLSELQDLTLPQVITLDEEEIEIIRVFHWPGQFCD